MKKIVILLLISGIAWGSWYAYREYNRKPATASDLPTDFKLSADDLMKEFENEEEATKKYLQKIIEVNGKVTELILNDNAYDVLLETEDPMNGINVRLLPGENEKAKSLKPGDQVTLKGKCNGKLSDVELNVGVIL